MTRSFAALLCFSASLLACDGIGSVNEVRDAGADAGADASSSAPAMREPGPQCDPRAPDCPADEKCTTTHLSFDAPWPTPRCTPDVGDAGLREGDACFSSPGVYDYCGSGLACTNYGTGEGFCRGLCRAVGEGCGEPGSVCATVDPVSDFMLCLPRCQVDADCGFEGFLICAEREGVRFCDSAGLQR